MRNGFRILAGLAACLEAGCSTYYYPSFDSPFAWQGLTKKLPLRAVEQQIQCELSNFIGEYVGDHPGGADSPRLVLDPNKGTTVSVNIQTDLSGKAQFVGIDLSKIGLSEIANFVTPSQKVPSLQASFAPKETVSAQIDFALLQSNNDVYNWIDFNHHKPDFKLQVTDQNFAFLNGDGSEVSIKDPDDPTKTKKLGINKFPDSFTQSDYIFLPKLHKDGTEFPGIPVKSLGNQEVKEGAFYKKAKNPNNGNPIALVAHTDDKPRNCSPPGGYVDCTRDAPARVRRIASRAPMERRRAVSMTERMSA